MRETNLIDAFDLQMIKVNSSNMEIILLLLAAKLAHEDYFSSKYLPKYLSSCGGLLSSVTLGHKRTANNHALRYFPHQYFTKRHHTSAPTDVPKPG